MSEQIIRVDLTAFEKKLDASERKQLPFAAMLALNDTAKGGRAAVQAEMRKVLDRPTPFALRGVTYERASKRNLQARVVMYGSRTAKGGLPAAYFLGPQVHGGKRSLKAFEKQLQNLGILPKGHVVIPAERAPLDRYGNVSQGMLNRILGAVEVDYRGAGATRVAVKDSTKRRNRRKRGRYFVVPAGKKIAAGIWHEPGFPLRAVYPVLLFVKQRGYTPRLDFDGIVRAYADANLDRHFAEAWAKATRTAR